MTRLTSMASTAIVLLDTPNCGHAVRSTGANACRCSTPAPPPRRGHERWRANGGGGPLQGAALKGLLGTWRGLAPALLQVVSDLVHAVAGAFGPALVRHRFLVGDTARGATAARGRARVNRMTLSSTTLVLRNATNCCRAVRCTV